MNSNTDRFPLKDVTGRIISAAMEVHSTLGPGLLESFYEEALAHEFNLRSIAYEQQKRINLKYKGKAIGIHRLDFVVEDSVILELKAVERLDKIFEAQLLTYLSATGKKVGLLMNFNVQRLKEGMKRLIV